MQWVLRKQGDIGQVHDPRVPRNLTSRFVNVAVGLLVKRQHEGTDGSQDSHWRHGQCLRAHAIPGKWYVKFEDNDEEEVVNCGHDDLYGMLPMPPTKYGQLEKFDDEGTEMLRCQNPLSGDYYADAVGEVLALRMEDLRVVEVRQKFEAVCGHPNGLTLMTPLPKSRPLDPYEDYYSVEDAFIYTLEDIMSDEKRLCLELWLVEKDGTRTCFWHSNMPCGGTEPDAAKSEPDAAADQDHAVKPPDAAAAAAFAAPMR